MTERHTAPPPSRARRLLRPRPIIALALVIVVVLFVLQNREPVQITVFALALTAPLWLFTLVCVAVGALIGHLAARRRT